VIKTRLGTQHQILNVLLYMLHVNQPIGGGKSFSNFFFVFALIDYLNSKLIL
jgi:hypothetical protein